ncbi:glucose-1-phosphate adenylyltransferase [Oscillospiraceae bacterium OttesenSCG-928-G22]|nr:glucose-1-phosphate adenylyltransferase [Oscillospiraceae bacterium OttesenSCG-928-G22]
MSGKKECVAMLLAGGQGSRLYVLTSNLAKPALPFGGKYRIIDFPLSNCANSDIDTVGVLTQYQPHELNAYIGSGLPWDLDRLDGGVHLLPPYVKGSAGQWYKGTANAIYQNISFVDQYGPDYVLILSGDHIYKMDYSKMLRHHKEKEADATIAVIDVPECEASRFGIMSTDEDGRIVKFEEKPAYPTSTLASMGIYVFNWPKLREYLIEDELDIQSENDFGRNIIPNMLKNGEVLSAYSFSGYWKDVGTIESLWEANMDILARKPSIDLFDSNWRIYSRNPSVPPHYIGETGLVSHSSVTEGCEIYGTVENSVLFDSVTVGEGAVVRYSTVMPRARIGAGAIIEYAIIAEDADIGECAKIGADPKETPVDDWGFAVLGAGVTIGAGATILPRQMVAARTRIPEPGDPDEECSAPDAALAAENSVI